MPVSCGAALKAQEYLASRGIGPAVAAHLGLGYSPGHGLRQALESRGFSEIKFRNSGLFTAKGAERFAGMVVVPEVSGGLVRWLAGRAIEPRTPNPVSRACLAPSQCLGLGG